MEDIARIAVCDDTLQAREQVELLVAEYTKRSGQSARVLTFATAQELLQATEPLDLLFLDIELGDASGVDLVPVIRQKYPEITIIFISTHQKYFVYSHRLHIFQFLCKPFDQQIFLEELERFFVKYRQKRVMYTVGLRGKKHYEIPICEILYIEAALRHLLVQHSKTGQYEKSGQISKEAALLTPYGFIRCHNSYLVNARYIIGIKNHMVSLTNPVTGEVTTLPVSKGRFAEVKETYQQWLLEQEG